MVWVWIYIVDIVDVINIVDIVYVGYFWLDIWCGFVPPEVPAQPFLPAASPFPLSPNFQAENTINITVKLR